MARKKLYIGSLGPYLYDNAKAIDDPDGDFAGRDNEALVTDGQLIVEEAPTEDYHVVRIDDLGAMILPPIAVADIANPVELNSIAGTVGTLILVYKVNAAATDESTLYAYDPSGPAVSVPYVVDASGAGAERWIAIAGRYYNWLAAHGLSFHSLWTLGLGANYALWHIDGELELFGTARVLSGDWVPASAIKAPGIKPATWKDWGISGVWEFSDATDDTLVANIKFPNEMDKAVAPTFLIGWSAQGVSPGNCEWQLEYLFTQLNENTAAAAQTTSTVVTAASVTANGLVVSSITLDVPNVNDVCMHARIKRLAAVGSNDTIVNTTELHGICLQYTMNKLGTAT